MYLKALELYSYNDHTLDKSERIVNSQWVEDKYGTGRWMVLIVGGIEND